jgi:RND family efflux transporter MFP subunit
METRRRSTTRRVLSLGALALGALALGGFFFDGGKDAPAAPPPTTVTVAPVSERQVTEWDEFTGRLEAVDAVEIRPRVSGYITRVAFAEGTEVRKGEVLFEIDPRPYVAELARAKAEQERARTAVELARREVERARRLVDAQAISREEFDARKTRLAETTAAVQAAEAAVTTARLNLNWTRVRSPIAGRVSRADVTLGNLVQAGPPTGTLLTTVVSLDPIYATFEVDERTYLQYAALARSDSGEAHTPVYLGLANEEGYPHQGRVDFVDNRVDPGTGTIRLRAVFSNADRAFTPGLFARLRFAGSAPHRATLVLDRAIGTDQDRKFVLALKPDSTLEYRPVTLGPLADGLRVVRSGLGAGEEIVIDGLQRVRPGMKVAPTTAPMAPDSTVTTAER